MRKDKIRRLEKETGQTGEDEITTIELTLIEADGTPSGTLITTKQPDGSWSEWVEEKITPLSEAK